MSRSDDRPASVALGATAFAALGALAGLALLAAPPLSTAAASHGAPGPSGGLLAEVAGVLPVSPPAGTSSFGLRLAAGELPRGAAVSARAAGRKVSLETRVLARNPDGSAARLEIRFPAAAARPLELRGLHLADPVALDPASGRPAAGATGDVVATDLAGLLEEAAWHGDLEREGSSPPAWWGSVEARLSPEVDPAPATQLDFIEAAYAEKGRPREAVRLYATVLDGLPRKRGPEANRVWLRGAYEIAHLYEGVLRDFPRALGWYLRCAENGPDDPAEARQNSIAAGFGAARAVEGLGERAAGLTLYRLLARDLILDPDPYGDLLLPEVFLRIGDAAKAAGEGPAAAAAYRATMAAAARLPDGAPSSFRAPGSAARAALRLLSAREVDFGRVADGTYAGEAFGYNAPVGVRMTFRAGRCTALHVTELGDKRPLDAYRLVPERILARQDLGVDAVTGATVTSRAVVSAATEAVYQAIQRSQPGPEASTTAVGGGPGRSSGGQGGH